MTNTSHAGRVEAIASMFRSDRLSCSTITQLRIEKITALSVQVRLYPQKSRAIATYIAFL
ncbi:MAG: hypothetical protein KME06_18465 [Kastovskya adunca ATA6-11-RM4]|nr:hypothetical protein [Kastovskya adunca ATA6-11-RM4]